MPEHRKVLALPRKDRWTWLELLAYVARQGNGGHVPAGVCDVLRWVTPSFLGACSEAGLLDVDGAGFKVHDWDIYNPKDPTKTERQARWRAKKKEPVDGDVDEQVDGEVDTRVDIPRAGTRACPVPKPLNPSPTPPPDEEENRSNDQPRMQAWLDYASRQAGVTAALPYARKGYATGAWPPSEQRAPDPSAECTECGERLGHGHADDCPALARSALAAADPKPEHRREQPSAENVERIAPPAEFLALAGRTPEPPAPPRHVGEPA